MASIVLTNMVEPHWIVLGSRRNAGPDRSRNTGSQALASIGHMIAQLYLTGIGAAQLNRYARTSGLWIDYALPGTDSPAARPVSPIPGHTKQGDIGRKWQSKVVVDHARAARGRFGFQRIDQLSAQAASWGGRVVDLQWDRLSKFSQLSFFFFYYHYDY